LIEIPSPDPKTWKILRTKFEKDLEALSLEELQQMLDALGKNIAKGMRARQLVRAELERRRR
jgi:hypothetical protein